VIPGAQSITLNNSAFGLFTVWSRTLRIDSTSWCSMRVAAISISGALRVMPWKRIGYTWV